MPQINRKHLTVLLGMVLLMLMGGLVRMSSLAIDKRADQELLRRCQAAMSDQLDEIRAGKIDCLVNPAPEYFNELLADAACKANLKTIYLGCDVSDPRLAQLRKLPNLKCIVFFWTENPDIFLEHIAGLSSIQELCFERSSVSRKGIEHIASLPNLKSLCLPLYNLQPKDLENLKNIPMLHNLVLTHVPRDNKLIPILKSLPHLRNLNINCVETKGEDKDFDAMLKNALPDCICKIKTVDG
jgi:hypothetical protein